MSENTTANEPTSAVVEQNQIVQNSNGRYVKGVPVKPNYDNDPEKIPEQTQSRWYQWLLFSWVQPLLDRADDRTEKNEPLLSQDLLKLPAHEDPGYNYHRIRVLWDEELKKNQEDPSYKPSVASVLWRTYRYRVLVGTTLRFISDGAAFAVPFLLKEYTKWLTDKTTPNWEGWLWLIGMVGCNIVMASTLQACMQHTLTAFNQMRNGLRLLIFDAILRYPASHEETGKIMAAHTQDTQALLELAPMVHGAFVGSFLVVGGAVALYFFIGYAGLAVFGILLITTPLQGVVMGKAFSLRGPFIKAGAKRVNVLSELLQGIRICKFMGWEENFVKKIDHFRSQELVYYTGMQRWRIPVILVMFALPIVINFAAFALQYAIEGSIEVTNTFAALTLLNALRIPIMLVPMSISKILDTKIAMDRVSEVCSYRGFYEYAKRHDENSDEAATNATSAILMKNISVLGDKSKCPTGKDNKKKETSKQASPTSPNPSQSNNNNNNNNNNSTSEEMKDAASLETQQQQQGEDDDESTDGAQIIADKLSVTIPRGGLTFVTGATASGKSVLIRSLIGEADVKKNQGSLEIYGSCAYIPQESWIMNATVRENIIMNDPFDQKWYDQVIDACQLRDDLAHLPGGDDTSIGERGVVVSGGQKARISIARAVYSKRSIIVADDPLSAVDPHVSAALFENIFSNEGLMKDRTRILVTHQTQLVCNADWVLVMKNNAIEFAGTYPEMKATGMFDIVTQCEEEEQKEKAAAAAAAKKKKEQEEGGACPENKDNSSTTTTTREPITTADSTTSQQKQQLEKKQEEEDPIEAEKKKQLADAEKKKKGELMSEEQNKAGDVEWDTYSWYIKLGQVSNFVGVLLMAFIAAGCFVISNFALALWSDHTGVPGLGVLEDTEYMGIMGVAAAIGTVFLVFRQWIFVSFISNVAREAHDAMMRNIVRAPTSFFDTVPLGRHLTRFQKDIQSMDFVVSENVQFIINQIFLVVGALVTVFISAPYVMIIMPFLIAYFYHLFTVYRNTVRGLKRLDGSSNSPVSAIVNETVGGLASIRVYEIGDSLYKEHESRAADSAVPQMNIRSVQRWVAVRSDLLGNVILLVVAGFGVISRHGDQSSWLPLTPSLIALAITSTIQATNSVTMLTRTLSDLSTEMASTERAKEYATELPQERTYDYEAPEHEAAPGPSWPSKTDIVFEGASMRYRDNLPLVLKKLNVTIPSGTRVGVCGRTGAGKSSLLLTLYRTVELAEGRIMIDGRDVSHLELPDLRSNLVMIPQDPLLFSGTIRSNLDPFDEHTDEEIWNVLDKLRLRDRLTTFITNEDDPKGLVAMVKEKAQNFSLGERQLLCLARAMLKKTAGGRPRNMIVTLDEASASVDDKTDALIQKTIREEFKSSGSTCNTMLVIAHRLSTIIDSDYILVLDQGELAEFDKPINLLNKPQGDPKSIFRGMCEKLGSRQFEALRKIAAGEMSYAESLGMDTAIEE